MARTLSTIMFYHYFKDDVIVDDVIILLLLQVDKLDEKVFTWLAYLASGDVAPMQAVIGSITAQEVMKVSNP